MTVPISILLVEDDPDFASSVRLVLEDAGYEIIGIANNCSQALKLASERTPDLAILDLQLDDEIDGVTLGFELTASDVPIIYLTGDITIAIRQAYEIASDFLEKPLRSVDLLAAVENSLSARRQPHSLKALQSP
ncbi:response regulator [Pelagibius sp. Alg239-R121]|uniref:response regulator n=1 Tax=Pelagibius sp. Alg239-R121 TaxID=2993448 RepID=UPI0024A6AF8D|nr:response regulator [Pelagibius sp. Alg239-R121]